MEWHGRWVSFDPGTALGSSNTTSDGKISRAAAFGATDDNVDVGTGASLRPGSITVELWAYPECIDTAPDRHPFMVTQDQQRPEYLGYYLEIYRTMTYHRFGIYPANGTTYAYAHASPQVANQVWYHVVGARDAGTGVTSIYVNGVQVGTHGIMTGGIAYDDTKPVLIGGIGTQTWDGLLDEVRISDTNRSADWIATEYNNQDSPLTFYTMGSEETPP